MFLIICGSAIVYFLCQICCWPMLLPINASIVIVVVTVITTVLFAVGSIGFAAITGATGGASFFILLAATICFCAGCVCSIRCCVRQAKRKTDQNTPIVPLNQLGQTDLN